MALTKEDLQAIGSLIDTKLQPMQEEIQAIDALMDAKLQPMQEEIQAIDALMDSKLQPMQEDIRKLNQTVAVIEVEHGKKLDVLFDGHMDMNRKIDTLQATVDEMASTVLALDVLHQTWQHK